MQEFWFKNAVDGTYMVQRYIGDEKDVSVPASWYGSPVTVLMDDIFRGHTEIEKVTLPDSLYEIGGFVFDGCTSLKEITLPGSLRSLWQYAFVRSSFTELVIPAGVGEAVPFCFKDCRQLKKVTFLCDHLKLRGRCFDGCTALETIVVPEDTVIHENAFSGCGQITTEYRR